MSDHLSPTTSSQSFEYPPLPSSVLVDDLSISQHLSTRCPSSPSRIMRLEHLRSTRIARLEHLSPAHGQSISRIPPPPNRVSLPKSYQPLPRRHISSSVWVWVSSTSNSRVAWALQHCCFTNNNNNMAWSWPECLIGNFAHPWTQHIFSILLAVPCTCQSSGHLFMFVELLGLSKCSKLDIYICICIFLRVSYLSKFTLSNLLGLHLSNI